MAYSTTALIETETWFAYLKGSVTDPKHWKDIVGQRVGPDHRSLTGQMTQFLSPHGQVYQRCPEYLTGKKAPGDLICTGVHLVQVVSDNLHIMSDLHPRFIKWAHLIGQPVLPSGGWAGGGCLHIAGPLCANPLGD